MSWFETTRRFLSCKCDKRASDGGDSREERDNLDGSTFEIDCMSDDGSRHRLGRRSDVALHLSVDDHEARDTHVGASNAAKLPS